MVKIFALLSCLLISYNQCVSSMDISLDCNHFSDAKFEPIKWKFVYRETTVFWKILVSEGNDTISEMQRYSTINDLSSGTLFAKLWDLERQAKNLLEQNLQTNVQMYKFIYGKQRSSNNKENREIFFVPVHSRVCSVFCGERITTCIELQSIQN